MVAEVQQHRQYVLGHTVRAVFGNIRHRNSAMRARGNIHDVESCGQHGNKTQTRQSRKRRRRQGVLFVRMIAASIARSMICAGACDRTRQVRPARQRPSRDYRRDSTCIRRARQCVSSTPPPQAFLRLFLRPLQSLDDAAMEVRSLARTPQHRQTRPIVADDRTGKAMREVSSRRSSTAPHSQAETSMDYSYEDLPR